MPYKDKEKRRKSDKRRRDKIAKDVDNFKSEMGCKRCGEKHPAVLDCHHRDPKIKYGKVSQLINHKSYRRVFEEIAKCDVLCANCHRLEHWEEKSRNGVIGSHNRLKTCWSISP